MLHLDTGNTGFMILCTSLVMLMTPGLAFFYGGLVGRKNVLAIMIQSFVSMGWTTVHLVPVRLLAVLLRRLARDHRQSRQRLSCAASLSHAVRPNDTIPAIVFIAYQMMFAIITPALITGAFTNRVTFKAYMIFLTGVAAPSSTSRSFTWCGAAAFLQRMGREGLRRRHRGPQHRRHRRAGFGALRRRRHVARSRTAQHSAGRAGHRPAVVRLVRLQRRQRNARQFRDRASAFLNTDIAASFAAVTWLVVAGSASASPSSSAC